MSPIAAFFTGVGVIIFLEFLLVCYILNKAYCSKDNLVIEDEDLLD